MEGYQKRQRVGEKDGYREADLRCGRSDIKKIEKKERRRKKSSNDCGHKERKGQG